MAFYRHVLERAGRTSATAFISLAAISFAAPASAVPTIDGFVQGFAEGYDQGWNISFELDSGDLIPGGELFMLDTSERLYVGFIAPLDINDNTYGANVASDWGSTEHTLKKLEGSDKWELEDFPVQGGDDLEIKLDYIEEDGGVYDARVEKFKQDGNLDASAIEFETSLSYNYEILGLTQYFENDDDDSPSMSGGDYMFDAPAQQWIPHIMFEWSIGKDAFDGTFGAQDLLNNTGMFHMSPNKLDQNALPLIPTTPIDPTSAPVPGTMFLLSLGLAGLAVSTRRRANDD